MAGSPQWKVYSSGDKKYVAACKYVEDAAALVALYGDGATIRKDHRTIVWTEGVDGKAAESYDDVASHVHGQQNRRALPSNLCFSCGHAPCNERPEDHR